jgi:reactive chlorine resistance protein C
MEAVAVKQAESVHTTLNLKQVGSEVARWGLMLCLLFIGLAKFTPEEAQGIQPLIAHSPLMAWMYSVWSLQGVSNVIGTIELVLAVLLVLGIWSVRASLFAGVGCTITLVLTVSFIFSTPGALVFVHGLPALGGTGQFLIKDVVLLGASIGIAGRAVVALGTSFSLACTGGK